MRISRLPELELYRGWREKAWAIRVILSRFRLIGLFLPPRVLAIVAILFVGLQVSPVLIRPLGLLGAFGVATLVWALLLSTIVLSGARLARPALRRDLIRRGIPVCLGCGYDLRGTLQAARCPECRDDVTNLLDRTGEPLPETAIYPELAGIGSTDAAKNALREAKKRAGLLVRFRRSALLGVLILLTAAWTGILGAANDLADWAHRDLSALETGVLLGAAIASYPLVAAWWYSLVISRVRRALREGRN